MGSEAQAVIRRAGDGRQIVISGGQCTVKVGAAESAGRLGVIEERLNPGFAGPPMHVHRSLDHVWYVTAGELSVVVDGAAAVLRPGDCAFIPRGTPHTFGNPGEGVAVILELDTPRALEQYFDDLAERFPPGAALDPVGIGEIQRRHDTFPVV